MEEIFFANSKASFIYNEGNKQWTITCFDDKGKTLWGKNVGREEGNKILLDFCCNSVGYISYKSLVDTVCICDRDGYEYGYVCCHKNTKDRIDKIENLEDWFYTLLIDTLVKMEKNITIKKYFDLINDFLNFCIYNNEEKKVEYSLNIADASYRVQYVLILYLLDYMKKEEITFARDLGREIVLNHIHVIDAYNIKFVKPLINEIHKLTKKIVFNNIHIDKCNIRNISSSISENYKLSRVKEEGSMKNFFDILEENSMKLARIKNGKE